MPRQDVPYGGAICRLKERIAEIFDKLGEKLHTINGVPGDGDGNVKIVSGSSAVVISNDPTQNEIEIALDSSQLPAAAVSSVNGQTGAVALDAGDIPTVGGDVQADLQDLANDISSNTAAINAEVLARQNADSTLQTNINTISAGLPAAAAAAVAADPTVAQLANDVTTLQTADGQNVKLSGSQNITGIKSAPTEATGIYSQQIANSQKVKNELDNYAPMIRTANNQKKSGVLWVNDLNSTSAKNTGSDAYFIFARLSNNALTTSRFSLIVSSRGPYESGYYCLWASTATTMSVVTTATQPASFKIVTDGTYQYFAVLLQTNNIKRITFLDQMDAFDRQLPDMTLFSPYPVTTETDVMVSQ